MEISKSFITPHGRFHPMGNATKLNGVTGRFWERRVTEDSEWVYAGTRFVKSTNDYRDICEAFDSVPYGE